jgi:hypothetical protein
MVAPIPAAGPTSAGGTPGAGSTPGAPPPSAGGAPASGGKDPGKTENPDAGDVVNKQADALNEAANEHAPSKQPEATEGSDNARSLVGSMPDSTHQ